MRARASRNRTLTAELSGMATGPTGYYGASAEVAVLQKLMPEVDGTTLAYNTDLKARTDPPRAVPSRSPTGAQTPASVRGVWNSARWAEEGWPLRVGGEGR